MKQLSGSELKKKNRIPKGCILLPCLFNFYAKYIMQNSGLSESQAVIKIAGKTINNLRYVDDTTVKEEGEEELKNIFFMKLKEENTKAGLELNIKKKKKIWHLVSSLHGIDGGKKWKQ